MIRILAVLEFFIQLSFAIHAMKSGKETRWVFIILAFPVVGCVAYYFVEIFPGSRDHLRALKAARKLARTLRPDAELKRRVQDVETCGSVDNRMALAAECVERSMYGEAIQLYESCLHGAYATDANILYGLAAAAVEGGNADKAAAAIQRLNAGAPGARQNQVRLLEARLHEMKGENDPAIEAYRALLPVYVGLEAKFRYGGLLAKMGQCAAATTVYEELVKQAKQHPPTTEDEEHWLAAAKRAIVSA
jgi:hypothetical protein